MSPALKKTAALVLPPVVSVLASCFFWQEVIAMMKIRNTALIAEHEGYIKYMEDRITQTATFKLGKIIK
ncbi:MAG: hypothetical protein ACO3MB_03390 [Saprospiraceae bacterium]